MIDNMKVAQMNDEVTAENFWEIVDKYNLETPGKYNFNCLSEKNGIEVWGISDDGDFLVYDEYDGFYLLSEPIWINEAMKFLSENYNFEFGDEFSLEAVLEAFKEVDEEE